MAPAEGSAPPDPGRFVLGEHAIPAPEGHTFDMVLPGDADGDGLADAFAWAADAAGGGQLLFFAGRDRGEARPPIHVEKVRAGCRPKASVRRLGRETVALALRFVCEADAGAREAFRWVVVRSPVSPGAAVEARLVLDRRAPPEGEQLDLEPSAADRDGDGREDLVFLARLVGAPPPLPGDQQATAELVYLDRPAGYTLDPTEPARSLGREATELLQRARRKDDAEGVPARVVPLVRLATALCGGLGAPLVSTDAGPLRCGDVDAVGDGFAASALSALTRDDLPGAVAWAEASRALGDRAGARAKDVTRELDRRAPVVVGRVVGRVPREPEGAASLATPPLAWDVEGRLLVALEDRVVTIGGEGLVEPVPAAAWPREVTWAARGTTTRLLGVTRRCGPTSLVASLQRGDARIDLDLPDRESLVPGGLRKETCTAGRVDVGVLSLRPDRALIAIGPSILGIDSDGGREVARWASAPSASDAPAPPGAARATDGATFALLTGGDALVTTAKGAKRWRAVEIAAAASCSPSPGGERLACSGARGVSLLEPSR